jgi:DHA1 family multidrug resistance protein-like MFS transporter
LLNHFSAGRILPYPEQKADYVVPERYILTPSEKGRSDATPSLGVTHTDTLSSDIEITTTELDQSGRPREEEVKVPKDVVLVTWEGDDDPENPLNWLVTLLPLFHMRCRSDE